MTEPTPPRGSEPSQPATGRDGTRPFAAPVPPQQPTAVDGTATATPAEPPVATPARTRRGTVLMGAAAAGLLGVGVVVGVIVGQATAGSAADTSSSTTWTGPDGSQQYGVPPDGGTGGMPPGGRGDRGGFGPGAGHGATNDGTTGDGTTGDGTTGGGTAGTTGTPTAPDRTTLGS